GARGTGGARCGGRAARIGKEKEQDLFHVIAGFGVRRDAVELFDGAGSGVVGGQDDRQRGHPRPRRHHRGLQRAQEAGGAEEVVHGIEGVGDVVFGRRRGHQLHQALRAFWGDGAGVVGGFGAGDRLEQGGIDAVEGAGGGIEAVVGGAIGGASRGGDGRGGEEERGEREHRGGGRAHPAR